MIKNIKKLSGFGVFQNFTHTRDLEDFKKRNLIFGWNYSGKTTLSKLFRILEAKNKDRYFSGAEFSLVVDPPSGSQLTIDKNDLTEFPYSVKVFSSDYVNDVFTWDTPEDGFSAISFYLGDQAGNLTAEIEQLETSISRLEHIRENRYKKIVNAFDKFAEPGGKFTGKAKEIRENYLPNTLDQNSLNKSTIEELAIQLEDNPLDGLLLENEKAKTLSEAQAQNIYDPLIEHPTPNEKLPTLTEKVRKILIDTALKSTPFPELDKNTGLFDWVQRGLEYHQHSSDCKFCDQKIPPQRLSNLNNYYSKKLLEIQKAIELTKGEIVQERSNFDLNFPNEKDIGESFRVGFTKALSTYNAKKEEYFKQLQILEADLERKKEDYFSPAIPDKALKATSFGNALQSINDQIRNHNEWVHNFDERKKLAVEKMVLHFVSEFLNKEHYFAKKKDKGGANQVLARIKKSISEHNRSIEDIRTKLSDIVTGQKKLNSHLGLLLNRDDIKIEIENEQFSLERSGHPATNLSEGEKSAIAFSYFLTELESLREEVPSQLANTIIFIDDPISSLDSNHIFQVRSLLNSFLVDKSSDYKQLFISTHNFEFFSVMLDSDLYKRDSGLCLQIVRDNHGASWISKLPKSFTKYKSEYTGLFHILLEFYELGDSEKNDFKDLLLLPNALRRCLELYTLAKYPASTQVEKRMRKVFGSEEKNIHNLKLLHWFSHQNQFHKIAQHDDKILQTSGAIDDFINYVKKNDPLHWEGLNTLRENTEHSTTDLSAAGDIAGIDS